MLTCIHVVVDHILHSYRLIFVQIIIKSGTMIFKTVHRQVFLRHVLIYLVHFLAKFARITFFILQHLYLRVILRIHIFRLFHSPELLNYLILQVRHLPRLCKHFLIKAMLLISKAFLLRDKRIADLFQFVNEHLTVRLRLIFHQTQLFLCIFHTSPQSLKYFFVLLLLEVLFSKILHNLLHVSFKSRFNDFSLAFDTEQLIEDLLKNIKPILTIVYKVIQLVNLFLLFLIMLQNLVDHILLNVDFVNNRLIEFEEHVSDFC